MTHGNSHRGRRTTEYRTWEAMIARCENPKNSRYPIYGGRGITVCDEWRCDFSRFLADLGPKPSPQHSLDRIDNSLGYYPGNCRWATRLEQANNHRDNRRIEYKGETLTLAQWAKRLNLPYHTLKNRTGRLGWSPDRAFNEPIQIGRRRIHADLS